VTCGPKHHFFGYYDKQQWDATGRYLLCQEVSFMDRPPREEDRITIGMIDLKDGNKWYPLAQAAAWNWQQGAMLQWLPSAPDRLVIHNDRVHTRFVSVIHDVHTGQCRILDRPIYCVSPDGKQALSLNFARLQRTRPGYGYVGVSDPWEKEDHPSEDGIFLMDLENGRSRLIISLSQIVAIRHDRTMDGAEHKFNHLLFSPDGSRFVFLHRWTKRRHRPVPRLLKRLGIGRRKTRMFTAAPDGSNIHLLADHGMVSHFGWRDSTHLLAWSREPKTGKRYHLYTDLSEQVEVVGEGTLMVDGHCSYSPDKKWILTDTYPGKAIFRTLILYNPEQRRRVDIGRFFSPKELVGEIRCDLHPRWSRDGRFVSIDSAHEGSRLVYVVDVSDIVA
jgi:hypothetical protein